jgi:hypothetical protein
MLKESGVQTQGGAPVTSDTIRGFDRDTARLAAGVLGAVVFAALVLAAQEYHPTKANPTEEAVQAGSGRLLNANVVTRGNAVAKTSNDKMAYGEGSGVDHAFNKTSPQDDPSSQIEPAGTTPAPVFAFTPEINRDDTQADSDSAFLARWQESARAIGPKVRNVSNRSSAASRYVAIKRRLIEIWNQSSATGEKSRSWTAFSHLNRGESKKAAYTAETSN